MKSLGPTALIVIDSRSIRMYLELILERLNLIQNRVKTCARRFNSVRIFSIRDRFVLFIRFIPFFMGGYLFMKIDVYSMGSRSKLFQSARLILLFFFFQNVRVQKYGEEKKKLMIMVIFNSSKR